MGTDAKTAHKSKLPLLMVLAKIAQQAKLPKMEEAAMSWKLNAKLTKKELALPNVNHAQTTPEFHLMVLNASDAHKVKLLPKLVFAECAHQAMELLMELTVFNLELLADIDKEESATLNAKLAHHTPKYLKTVPNVPVADQTLRWSQLSVPAHHAAKDVSPEIKEELASNKESNVEQDKRDLALLNVKLAQTTLSSLLMELNA